MSVPVYHYGILKGYLAAQNAPAEIFAAVEALYTAAINPPLSAELRDTIQRIMDAADRLPALAGAKAEAPVETGVEQPAEVELPPLTRKMLEKAHERAAPPAPPPAPRWEDPGEVVMVPLEPNPSLQALLDQPPAPKPCKREESTPVAEHAGGRPRKPPFDSDLVAVKAEFETGLSFDKIGRKYRCSGGHVRNFLVKHGIDPRRGGVRNGGRPALTEAETQLIIGEKAKGTPSKEIGEMIDRSQHAVDQKYSELKKTGKVPEEQLTPEFQVARKEKQNQIVSEKMKEHHARRGREPRLGEELIEPIKRLVANGLSDVEIGKQYDVGSQTVADFRRRHGIKKRQGWSYHTKGAPPREDSPPDRLISEHNSYAGKRDPQPSPLQESDWPDIEQMLHRQRRSVSQIAGDYEVDFDTMRAFIDEHSPGEPWPHGGTGTAA